MALIKQPKLRFPNLLYRLFNTTQTTLSSEEIQTQTQTQIQTQTQNQIQIQVSQPLVTLSPEESLTAEKIHSLFKSHRRKCLSPTTLSDEFSHLSTELRLFPSAGAPISAAIVKYVVEKSAAFRHNSPAPETVVFFNWAHSQPGLLSPSNPAPYIKMIDLAGKAGLFEDAWNVIELMKAGGVEMSTETFVPLVRRYVRAGLCTKAVRTFNQMGEFGVTANQKSFASVIAIFCKKRCAGEAQAFFDGHKGRFEPDVAVYTCLIRCWCHTNNIRVALDLLAEMKEKGVEPNVYTYSVLISTLCQMGNIARARYVLDEMVEAKCEPNLAIFNSFMKFYSKADDGQNVLSVIEQMKRTKCEPDVITYDFVIECYCKNNKLNKAEAVLNSVVEKGLIPNVLSLNLIFRGIQKIKKVNRALKLFDRMKELGLKGNKATYNVLMEMVVESKSIRMVMNMKAEIDAEKVDMYVNTYSVLIALFCEIGDWENAYKFLKEMVDDKGLKPNLDDYVVVLKELTKAGQLQRHEELVEMMVANGFMARPVQRVSF